MDDPTHITEAVGVGSGRRVLAIYALPGCPGWDAAHRLASLIGVACPNVDVRLIDLGAPGVVRAPAVFAVPTYLLDGEVVSLGNPDPAVLLARLASGPASVAAGSATGVVP